MFGPFHDRVNGLLKCSPTRLPSGRTSAPWCHRARSAAANSSRVAQFAPGPLVASASRVVRSTGNSLPRSDPAPVATGLRPGDHLSPFFGTVCSPVRTPSPHPQHLSNIDRNSWDSSFDSRPGSPCGTVRRATRCSLGSPSQPDRTADRCDSGKSFAGSRIDIFRTGNRTRFTLSGQPMERTRCPRIHPLTCCTPDGSSTPGQATPPDRRRSRSGTSDLAFPLHP